MRIVILAVLMVFACSPERKSGQTASDAGGTSRPSVWTGQGRDRLCISRAGDDWTIGIATFGRGDANCTIQTRVVLAEHGSLVQARGDPACEFFIISDGTTLSLPSRVPAACAYYCGPGASLPGKKFRLAPNALPATDLVGDPLC